MAAFVEHEKRKQEILKKSLDLFIEEGYEDVTFQKIADRCGITRTTLYIYFNNKREIFLWSIKQLTSNVEKELMNIISNQNLNAIDCLKNTINKIFDICEENKQLFTVLLSYLIQLQKSGADVNEKVTRRVIKIQHLLTIVILRGQRNGEIKKELSIKELNDLFYSLMESAIFKLAVLDKKNLDNIRQTINFTVDLIKANGN